MTSGIFTSAANRHFDSDSSGGESGISIQITEAKLNDDADEADSAAAAVPRAGPYVQPYRLSEEPSDSFDSPIYTSTVDWTRPIGKDDFLYRQQLSELRTRKHGITRLSIIDFDNTLFKSPLPNPQLWDQRLNGMLRSTDLGWFQDGRTLSSPYLEYTDNHWITPIETLTEIENSRSDTLVMLLTGRSHTAYRQTILDLLSRRKNLRFDIVILKETPTRQSPLVSQVDFSTAAKDPQAPLTFDYKMAVVEDTIAAFPDIQKISMWDDRENQCEKMQKYLNALRSRISHITKAQVYHVPPQTIPMRESNERRLVHTMIQEYNARVRTSTVGASESELPVGSLLTKDYVSYTGVFLDHASRRLLKKNVRCPTGWSKTDHHMTLTLGPATAEELNLCIGAQLGETVELVVDGLGTIANAVIAVRVALARVQGKGMALVPQVVGTTPHITIGYNEPAGFKPSYANNIKAWRPLRFGDLVLRGVVGEKMLTTATIIAPEVPGQVPDEVSVGSLVCQRWPMLKGRDIGVAVSNARLRMETQGVKNVEANRGKIVDIVNGLFCA